MSWRNWRIGWKGIYMRRSSFFSPFFFFSLSFSFLRRLFFKVEGNQYRRKTHLNFVERFTHVIIPSFSLSFHITSYHRNPPFPSTKTSQPNFYLPLKRKKEKKHASNNHPPDHLSSFPPHQPNGSSGSNHHPRRHRTLHRRSQRPGLLQRTGGFGRRR